MVQTPSNRGDLPQAPHYEKAPGGLPVVTEAMLGELRNLAALHGVADEFPFQTVEVGVQWFDAKDGRVPMFTFKGGMFNPDEHELKGKNLEDQGDFDAYVETAWTKFVNSVSAIYIQNAARKKEFEIALPTWEAEILPGIKQDLIAEAKRILGDTHADDPALMNALENDPRVIETFTEQRPYGRYVQFKLNVPGYDVEGEAVHMEASSGAYPYKQDCKMAWTRAANKLKAQFVAMGSKVRVERAFKGFFSDVVRRNNQQ